MNITFLGASEGVTGSNFLVEAARKKVSSRLWIVSRNSERGRQKL